MEDSDRRSTKRSRFDQTEPEPSRRASRFDRRSRSPPARKADAESGRSRSPLSRSREGSAATQDPVPSVVDPAAAAAAAAAKIKAQLQAREASQRADAAPIRSVGRAQAFASSGPANVNGEMYIADGDFIKDIEVNDLRNRYLLTKGSTQKMIKDETGADVTTRGNYYPDKTMATPANPPLYLHVTSTTKEGLERAVAKIEELMKQELPQLVDERRFRRREEPVERDEYGRRKWPEEKIPINLEPIPGFNLRAQVVGHGGSYVKHIQQETGCRVQIKGRGSGYIESSTGRESEDDMFLHVAGPDVKMVEKAKEMCEDLLGAVKEQYEEFKSRPPRFGGDRHGGGGGYGDRHSDRYGDRYGDRHGPHSSGPPSGPLNSPQGAGQGGSLSGPHGAPHSSAHGGPHGGPHTGPHGGPHGSPHAGAQGYSGRSHNSYNSSSNSAPPTAPSAPAAAAVQTTPDYSQYAQYYGGADPYAAYGGYAAYVQMYQQYYAAQQSGQPMSAATPAAPSSASPPPPPPSDAAPPPPPPPSSAPPPPPRGPPGATGGYSAVPPPPGL